MRLVNISKRAPVDEYSLFHEMKPVLNWTRPACRRPVVVYLFRLDWKSFIQHFPRIHSNKKMKSDTSDEQDLLRQLFIQKYQYLFGLITFQLAGSPDVGAQTWRFCGNL